MPRTKQRKVKRTSAGYEQISRDFNRLVQLKIHKLELDFKGLEQKFDASMQLALSRYPTEIQNLTLRELLTIDDSPKKENIPPKTPRITKESKKSSFKPLRSTNPKRVTAVSDDGYQSESTVSQASKMNVKPKRRSRSASQDKTKERLRSLSRDRKSKLNVASALKTIKKDNMKTPSSKPMHSFVITPKVRLNSAINVLRKPKDGEMVFSTQGSPLLVSTTVNDRTANINVPLKNGNIVSLLPFNETSLMDNLHLDDETKHQLKILHSHLTKVLD
ncbi:PREDICTED: borealin-like [Ceratosolen solmsi marchali]|uniref:Borealin-like n=1 Tax=Ceratosolen solmsi marchali TaxID=326594 RepID=A0AAJ6YXQ6_9HYME|nr:PREDICTED: borealin-like [Ceratosolen solmsi marchali]